jgi:hypothetical protein
VGVWSSGQQLGRAFVNALGMLAAEEPAMVQKELQESEPSCRRKKK